MNHRETVTLTRDCEAIEIPYGQKIPLKAGTAVTITQALGGAFTVITDQGYQVRIDGKDADALGKQAAPTESTEGTERAGGAAASGNAEPLEKKIWDQLRTCYDPEIPVNIVELGLVYQCQLTPAPEGGSKVEIKLTLTAPGCGMGDVLKADVEHKIVALPGVAEVNVELVVDPPWNPGMMSEAAKLQLGFM